MKDIWLQFETDETLQRGAVASRYAPLYRGSRLSLEWHEFQHVTGHISAASAESGRKRLVAHAPWGNGTEGSHSMG